MAVLPTCGQVLNSATNVSNPFIDGRPWPRGVLLTAMYKGDERTRTMDVYVDDELVTSWTTSGITTAFENIDFGVNGQAVELRGVLGEEEWLSIAEVRAVEGGISSCEDLA